MKQRLLEGAPVKAIQALLDRVESVMLPEGRAVQASALLNEMLSLPRVTTHSDLRDRICRLLKACANSSPQLSTVKLDRLPTFGSYHTCTAPLEAELRDARRRERLFDLAA